MQHRVDFAYNFQSLYLRLSLSKFGNYETQLIMGFQRQTNCSITKNTICDQKLFSKNAYEPIISLELANLHRSVASKGQLSKRNVHDFERYLYCRQRSNADLSTDVHTVLWHFHSLQIYQLPSNPIQCVTACHDDERHLIKDFNKRKE